MVSVNFLRALFSLLDFLTIAAGTECPKMSVRNYHCTLHIISEEYRSHMMIRQCRPWFSSAWSSSEPPNLEWSTFGTSYMNLRPHIFNPLCRNGKTRSQYLNALHSQRGKHVPQCHVLFKIFCIYNYTAFFYHICFKGL